MRLNNKGVSPLIATVLLIAFTVILAFAVSEWAQNIAKKTTESAEEQATKSLYCESISISVDCVNGKWVVRNRGTLNIDKLIIRNGGIQEVDGVAVNGERDIDGNIRLVMMISEKVEVIPIKIEEDKEISCYAYEVVGVCPVV